MYYVYFIQSVEDHKNYVGFTANLDRRIAQHNAGASCYTSGRHWELVYYEAYRSRADAVLREKRLKQYGKSLAMLKRRLQESFL